MGQDLVPCSGTPVLSMHFTYCAVLCMLRWLCFAVSAVLCCESCVVEPVLYMRKACAVIAALSLICCRRHAVYAAVCEIG